MNVISRRTLIAFCEGLPKREQASAKAAMNAWHKAARAATWTNFADIKETFNTVDWVGGKVVFDVGGNKYRVVSLIVFRTKRVMILFVGTHEDYDDIDVSKL